VEGHAPPPVWCRCWSWRVAGVAATMVAMATIAGAVLVLVLVLVLHLPRPRPLLSHRCPLLRHPLPQLQVTDPRYHCRCAT